MILVTGSTGMIGRALVTRLLSEGFKVKLHARSTLALENLFSNQQHRLTLANGIDIRGSELEKAVADISTMTAAEAKALCAGCSTVIHTAGLVHQPQAQASLYESSNTRANKLLADAAITCGVNQFIYLSSTSVYGNRATAMLSENGQLHPDTPYAASKIASEEYLRLRPPAPSTVVLRPALVFGEGDRGNMRSLIRQISSGKYFIVGNGSAQKSLIYAGDLAAAICLLIKSPKKQLELFNIANPESVTVKQLSESILSACGKKASLLSVPSWLISIAAVAANLVLQKKSPLNADRLTKLTRDNSVSVSAFQQAYNFKPEHDLESALAKEIAWLRQNHSN